MEGEVQVNDRGIAFVEGNFPVEGAECPCYKWPTCHPVNVGPQQIFVCVNPMHPQSDPADFPPVVECGGLFAHCECRMGKVRHTFEVEGVTYRVSWDFEYPIMICAIVRAETAETWPTVRAEAVSHVEGTKFDLKEMMRSAADSAWYFRHMRGMPLPQVISAWIDNEGWREG